MAVINNSGGTVANRYGYDPYGLSTSKSETTVNPWQYAAGYLDPTGLTKFGTRYYDPNIGRWTQQDPIGGSIAAPTTINRYAYVGNEPVDLVDPTGTGTAGCLPGAFSIGAGVGLGGFQLSHAVAVTRTALAAGDILGLALIGTGFLTPSIVLVGGVAAGAAIIAKQCPR